MTKLLSSHILFLASSFTAEFLSGDFLEESYFDSTKDRLVRGLRTYFESRRADSHAVYYRDALLASKDEGIEESLALAELVDFKDAKDHHAYLLKNSETVLDCLFSGNVSADDAKAFYSKAKKQLDEAQHSAENTAKSSNRFLPGRVYNS